MHSCSSSLRTRRPGEQCSPQAPERRFACTSARSADTSSCTRPLSPTPRPLALAMSDAEHRPPGSEAEADQLAKRDGPKPIRPSLEGGSFDPRRADHLQSLVDVLRNLPPAKPSTATLLVQLCAPILLGGKSLYDTLVAIHDLIGDGTSPAVKHVIAMFFGIAFMVVSAWACGTLAEAYRSALARTDPHHERVLRRARQQLVEEKRRAGEPLDDDERTLSQGLIG